MTESKNLNIFLSYGHDKNAELVEMIKNDLEKRGHDVWFDKSEIKTGDDWRRSITDGLSASDKVLSFLSKYATRDPGVCRDEIAIAIGVKGGNIQTILVENETEVKPPVNIGHIQWLDMHNWKALYEQGGKDWESWYEEKLAEIIRVVESDESRRFAGEIEKLAEYLQPIQSHARINDLLNRGFFGREWLFSKVEDWRSVYSDTSRVFVLLAGAGVGKSAFAAQLAHLRGDVVVAAHFCEWNKPEHSDARATVKSLAFQLATKFPDYRKYLLKLPGIDKLEQQSAAELFTYLVANPLSFSIDGGRQRCMILIDAVDEANAQNNQNELISLIADEFERTPHWLSLVVTSRPENDVLARLNKFNPRYIDAGAGENMADIQLYLQHRLSAYDTPVRDKAIESIIDKCEGNFLYAVEICNDIQNRPEAINEPEKFPAGMGNLFLNSFDRKFSGIDYNTQIAPLLEILSTAIEPISARHVCKLLEMKKRELNELLLKTGSFFPVNESKIKPFHKSLIDWLGNPKASERYYIDPEDAEQRMAEAHDQLLEELFDDPDTLEDADEYALQFALVHIYKAGMKKALNKRLLQIFDAEDAMYQTCKPALNTLVEWVVKNKKAEGERLLKNILNAISENANNKRRLSYFFDKQGNAFENIGFSTWALEFFEKSLKVREDLVALEPGRTDFRRYLSVSFSHVGNIYSDMGEGTKALELFEKMMNTLEDLVALEPGRTDFRRDLSVSFNNVGIIYSDMGQGPKALEYFEKSLKVREDLVALEPGRTGFRRDLSVSFNNVGNIYKAMGQGPKALEFFEKSLKVMEDLVALEPGRTDFRGDLSVSFDNVGNIYKAMGEGAKALEFFEKDLKVMEDLVALEPGRTDFRRDLSVSFNNVGNIYSDMGHGPKALEFFEKSLKVMEDLVALEPGRTDFRRYLSVSFNNVGNIYKAMGHGPKALEFFEKSLKVMEDLVALEPGRTDFRRYLSVSFNNVGNMYKAMGHGPKALERFEESLKVREDLVALEPDRTDFRRDLSVSFNNVGHIYRAMGQGLKALEFFEKDLKVMEDLVALEPGRTDFRRELSMSLNNVGYIYSDTGQGKKALEFFKKSLKVMEDLVALEPGRTDFRRELSMSLNNVGYIYSDTGQGKKALEFFKKSLKVMEDLVALEPGRTDFHRDLSLSFSNMGRIKKAMGQGTKAFEFFEKSLKVMEDLVALEPGNTDFRSDLSVSFNNVGNIYSDMGQGPKALEFFEKSLKVREDLVALEPGRTDFLVDYAISHWKICLVCPRKEEMKWLTKAKAILEPLVQKGTTHGQLQQLWDMVNKAINKNMNQ
jgi:tetratricopeptide (TPR) repeat protein